MKFIFTLLLFNFSLIASPHVISTQQDHIKEAKNTLILELQAKEEAFKKAQEKTLQTQPKQEDNLQKKKLLKLGIEINDDKIIIDTNKTKSFFESFGKLLGTKLEKMSAELESSMIDTNQTGIDINNEHINIDMKKTEKYLHSLEKKMQSFLKEFDSIAKEFNMETK